jgi:hypothetical protein
MNTHLIASTGFSIETYIIGVTFLLSAVSLMIVALEFMMKDTFTREAVLQ